MASLYRLRMHWSFLAQRSFGLVVSKAVASGTPVVIPGIAPFTEYLHENDVGLVRSLQTSVDRQCDAMALANTAAFKLAQPAF